MLKSLKTRAPRYIAAFDQGTTNSRCLIFDHAGKVVASSSQPLSRSFEKSGWVSQDAQEILSTQLAAFTQALAQESIDPEDIAAIGITNQRETTIVWDKHTGKPVGDAIVWQCRRSTPLMNELKEKGYEELIAQKTGLVLDAYFSAGKIAWILENIEGARARAEAGDLLFGTVDTWLIWNLSGREVHATDVTNASRTMLYNIHTLEYDDELLTLFNIPRSMMPEVKPSKAFYGTVKSPLIGAPIKLCGVAGDQQAALFGQGCFNAGEAKSTYGTGGFMLLNTGSKAVHSSQGLLGTIACQIDDQVDYALEGSIFNAGSTMTWLKEGLGILEDIDESSDIAESIKDNASCYLVPAFNGLGAPYWDSEARGVLVGLSQGTKPAHIIRAALEAIGHQSADIFTAMEKDAQLDIVAVKVDGKSSVNNFAMQMLADLLDIDVYRPKNTEATALGAAFLAGLEVGFWSSKQELLEIIEVERKFTPQMDSFKRAEQREAWQQAVARSLSSVSLEGTIK